MGDYALIITALQLISAFFSAGFDQALIRHPDDKSMASAAFLASTIQSTLLILASAFVYLIYFMKSVNSHDMLIPGVMVLASIILTLYFNLYSAPIASAMNYRLLSRIRLISTLFGICSGIAAALFNYGLYSLVIRDLSSVVVMAALVKIASPMRANWEFDRGSIGRFLAFAKGMWALNFMERFILRIDYALVGLVLGKEMLGIYFVIRGMLEGVLGFLIQPVQTVLYAHYCDTKNFNGKHLLDRFAISYWIALIFASIVAWFVASELFEYLLGSEYRIGASVMPGLVFYAGTVLWFENIKVISMAMNIHHELLYARVAQLVMFLAIFYPLIASAGITGAGLATAFAGLALAFTATKLFVNKAEKVEL